MKFLTILIIILIIIGIIVGLVYFYYSHEKPLQENKIITRDINIRVIDSQTNKNVISNYTIGLGSQTNIYRNGTSLLNNYIVEKLPENQTYYISSNINNISYYDNYKIVDTIQPGPFREDIELTLRGDLDINYNGNFGVNNDFNLTLSKSGELRNLDLCYLYSTRIILLSNNNSLQNIDVPDNRNYYKCFSLGDFNSTMTLNWNYIYFGNLDKYDYIDFLIFDNDVGNSLHKEFYYNVTM